MLTDQQIEEMMARVRKLELKARRLVRESFSGEYLSSFRGQGLDFDDFREYQHGDEVRFIDWNVTARMNTPFVRKFREERELCGHPRGGCFRLGGLRQRVAQQTRGRRGNRRRARLQRAAQRRQGGPADLRRRAAAFHPAGKGQPPPAAHDPRDPRRQTREARHLDRRRLRFPRPHAAPQVARFPHLGFLLGPARPPARQARPQARNRRPARDRSAWKPNCRRPARSS